jgi:hypothetical protein
MRGALSPIRERICPSRPRSFADAVSMIPTAAAESGALHRGLAGGMTGAIVDHACGSLVD